MKIGIDARLYSETGVGRYIQNLLKEYDGFDDGNEYFVFTTKKAVPIISLYKRMKPVEVSIRWHSLKEQLTYPFLLNRYDLDLIHFPYFSVPILNNHPFVVTIHDLTTLKFPTGKASTLPFPLYNLKHLGYKLILKNALYNSKKIIVPSKSVQSDLIKYYPDIKDKIVVTYEAATILKSDSLRKFTFEPYFLYVGNVYPHKNIEKVIQALKIYNENRNIKYRLIIVGKKDYFTIRLSKFIDSIGLSKQIVFQQSVSDDALSRLYKRAAALVFPSLSEGFGLPILEALAHGCLVTCSDIPVFKELYKEVPIYFDPNDVNSISQALKRVVDSNSSYKDKTIKEGMTLSENFSWKKTAEQTLAVYKEAV